MTLSPLALKFISLRTSLRRSDWSTTGLMVACLRSSGGLGTAGHTAGRAFISASCNARLCSWRRRSLSCSSSEASLASRSSRRRRRSRSSSSSFRRSSARTEAGDRDRDRGRRSDERTPMWTSTEEARLGWRRSSCWRRSSTMTGDRPRGVASYTNGGGVRGSLEEFQ